MNQDGLRDDETKSKPTGNGIITVVKIQDIQRIDGSTQELSNFFGIPHSISSNVPSFQRPYGF